MRILVSQKITDKLIKAEIIATEDKDLYTYGFQQGFLIILNMFTTIAIGLLFKMVWQSLVFLFAYIPLRSYAGGYHAKTPLRCYLFSILMMALALWGIKLIPWNGYVCLIITLCAGYLILLLSPVEDSNKPLDQKEIAIYKKRTQIVLSVLFVVDLLFWLTGKQLVSISITTAIFILSVMLIFGKFKK